MSSSNNTSNSSSTSSSNKKLKIPGPAGRLPALVITKIIIMIKYQP